MERRLNIVKRYRELDQQFREQISRRGVAICELHYADTITVKLIVSLRFRFDLLVSSINKYSSKLKLDFDSSIP